MTAARPAVFAEGLLTVRPPTRDALERFIADFVAVERPLLARWGIEIAGGWTRTTGTSRQILQLYRFDSFRAVEKSAIAMMTDPDQARLRDAFAWVDRPDFTYQRQLGVTSPLAALARVDSLPSGEAPRDYVEVRSRLRWGTQERAAELMGSRIKAWGKAGVFRLDLAYDIHYGRFGEVVALGRLPQGAPSLNDLDDCVAADVREALGEVLVEEELHLLRPLAHSTLQ